MNNGRGAAHRVAVYVDGFNLYFGMRERYKSRFYWLNIAELAARLVNPSHTVVATKYFTARVGSPPDKADRQRIYLAALDTVAGISLYYGRYDVRPRKCGLCKGVERVANEKMTDVQLACQMLCDAQADLFDTAIIVSGDSDLVPPIEAIRRCFPDKRVLVAFPPARISKHLSQVAHAWFTIGRVRLRKSQFPDRVQKPNGNFITKPAHWV